MFGLGYPLSPTNIADANDNKVQQDDESLTAVAESALSALTRPNRTDEATSPAPVRDAAPQCLVSDSP